MHDAAVLAPKDVSTLCRGGQLGPAFPPVLDGDSVRGRAVADALPHTVFFVACFWPLAAASEAAPSENYCEYNGSPTFEGAA